MPRLPLLGLLLQVGCISPKTTGTTTGDDTSSGDDTGGGSGGTTIMDLQNGVVAADTVVTLEGVVVTSGLTADGKGFFVEDPAGGAYSGIYVFLQGSFTDLAVYRDDVMTITGSASEFYDWTEFTVTSSSDISVTGELSGGITPDVLSEDTSTWTDTDWEPWESVLVTLPDQTVESAIDSYGTAQLSAGIPMDNMFFDYDTEYGATYTGVTGPLSYSYSAFTINPRDDGDLAGYVAGVGPETVTICDLQQQQEAGTWTDKPVTLEGVVATTGLTVKNDGFWVQEAGGGVWCGIYVYVGSLSTDNPDWTVTAGDALTLTGTVTEYPFDTTPSLTEISVRSIDDLTTLSAGNAVTPLALSADAVPSDDAGWEPYEGVLITLPDVTLVGDESAYGQILTNYGITLDDTLFYYDTLYDGDTFTDLTGVVNYSYATWVLLPRTAEDFSGGSSSGGTTTTLTVSGVQQGLVDGSVTAGEKVEVVDVVATSDLELDGKGFFVQDAGGGAWSGVYIYLGSASVSVHAGDVLTLTGTVAEYPTDGELTEIKIASASDVTVTGTGTPVATTLSAAPSDWEPYEGCLLTLTDVTVTSDADSYGEVTTSSGVNVDDLLYAHGLANGDALSSLTGPLHYGYSAFKMEPRAASDLVE